MDLLTEVEVGQLIGVAVTTLQQWRHRGKGPPFIREGRWVRYRRSDVEEWVSARADLTRKVASVHDDDALTQFRRRGGLAAQLKRTPEQRAEWGRKGAAARWAAKDVG